MNNSLFQTRGALVFEKSKEILHASQLSSGATTASLEGTRYAGYVYPRDHAYVTRALISINDLDRAHQALKFILNCVVSEDAIMFQRYDQNGKNASYKPPQIDGNAQTLLSVAAFLGKSPQNELLKPHLVQIRQLLRGILTQVHSFAHGSLIHSINGIIEYSPFEAGYDLYTNAVCCRALFEIAQHDAFISAELASDAKQTAQKIKHGIKHYLYYAKEHTFLPCLRTEPDSSFVLLANLKNYLALSDFEIFPPHDARVDTGLMYHLKATQNNELGGYNRYHELMGRHNFGNGPWPMVMLRLAQHYLKRKDAKKAHVCFTWVLTTAENNLDKPYCLPEHIASKESFYDEYKLFQLINETSPRPAKEKEYRVIIKSITMQKLGLAYAVNPLVWSHAQYILAWQQLQSDKNSHNW
jgi:GH15 family glucan-1,4-alpha-glucosidase